MIALSGYPEGDLPLKIHMVASGNCSDTEGRVGIIDIADFNAPGGKAIRVGGNDVDLTTDIKELTVCYEKANFIQVESYVFGDAGSGTPTKAPTASPTAGERRNNSPTNCVFKCTLVQLNSAQTRVLSVLRRSTTT
jgi:hypothetical protein